MTPHVNVIIATPGHSLAGQYVKSLLRTVSELSSMGLSHTWLNNYSSHVANAREVTLSNSFSNVVGETRPVGGAFTYDKIIWIDSDISWSVDDFIKLYESDRDVLSGAYMLSTGEVAAYPTMFGPGFRADEVAIMSDLVKVSSVGFGFLSVKSGVFERLTRPWFQSVQVTMKDDSGEEWAFPITGEDVSWCERVRALGYDIWLDPTIRVNHHKVMTLNWDGVTPNGLS